MDPETTSCGICQKNKASYTCPRCNLAYCNLSCYRNFEKHGECSESFYKDQVLTELEMLRIEDVDSKNQMAKILKNEARKQAEEEDFFTLDLENEQNITNEDFSEPKEDELIKEYLNEIINWRPWWHNDEFKASFLISEINSQDDYLLGIDEKLIEKTKNLNTENSNPLIYNEILKLFYFYQICIYIYQLRLDDFKPKKDEKVDLILLEEICNNYLEIEHLLNKRLARGLNIREEFESIITVLLEENSYFLKIYINKKFLLNLIDELELAQQKPNVQFKIISHMYELFSLLSSSKVEIKKKVEIVGNSCPMNVFHVNRERHTEVKMVQNGRSRVEIIKPANNALKNNERIDFKFSKRDYKLFIKRLEFYFKWLVTNKRYLVCKERKDVIKSELDFVKQSFLVGMEQFRKEKELIDQNLNRIKPTKSRLIEEI